jgi:hypothetical protein
MQNGSLGTGGSQIMDAQTGTIPGSVGAWHPTILYLFALLVVEWAALVFLSKYL